MINKKRNCLLFVCILFLSIIGIPVITFAYIPEPIPPPPPPPPPSGQFKMAVLIYSSDSGVHEGMINTKADLHISHYRNRLIDEGYSSDYIYILKDWSKDGLISFFTNTLDSKETSDDTIFIYIWGHGPSDPYETNPFVKVSIYEHKYTGKNKFYCSNLRDCINKLEAERIGFLIAGCKVGYFKYNFMNPNYTPKKCMAITVSDASKDSVASPGGENYFSYYFWEEVKKGDDAYHAYLGARFWIAILNQNPLYGNRNPNYVFFAN